MDPYSQIDGIQKSRYQTIDASEIWLNLVDKYWLTQVDSIETEYWINIEFNATCAERGIHGIRALGTIFVVLRLWTVRPSLYRPGAFGGATIEDPWQVLATYKKKLEPLGLRR